MSGEQKKQPATIERIERALVLLAYFMELDGDVHLPLYEKFEQELAELQHKESVRQRARKRLLASADIETLKSLQLDTSTCGTAS